MMRTLALVALLQGARDPFFGADKIKHFFLSAFVQSVAYSVTQVTTRGGRSSVLLGASAATAAVGIGKELSDLRSRGEFSVRDLVWDGAGAGAATLILLRTRH